MKLNVPSWNRIILFRQSRIGDTLVTFPLIEALHQLYPKASLVYCTQHFKLDRHLQGHDVAKLSPHIKEIITYNVEDSVIKKYLKLKRTLKICKDDLLIYLPYNRVQRYQIIRDWIFFKALNFKNMICFKETWEWTYLYEKKNYELPKETERMSGFIRSAGIPVEILKNCPINYDKEWAEEKWKQWGITDKDVIALCPGSNMQSKRWPVERYIAVGKKWNEKTGMQLVIVGGPEEAGIAKDIISYWPGYGFSACGANLSQTAGILRKVKAYCGNDTGAMHLAAIMGIPCVAIFSSREQEKLWYPLGENHIVLKEDVDCKKCNLQTCHTTPPLCLDNISTDKVLDALTNIFKQIYGKKAKITSAP